jgi:DNA-binding NarL/FixJ family response regulator
MNFKEYFKNKDVEQIVNRKFTQKELEVIEMVAKGITINEIAHDLIISSSTVKTHLSNIRTKFNFDTEDISNIRVMLCIFWQKYGDCFQI